MKIKSFYIEGLFGCREPITIDFNQNIHVISGKNGAGKTTILKLVWYFISGNLEKALIEVPFQKIILNTDLYNFEVNVTEDADNPFSTHIEYVNKEHIRADIAEINPEYLNEHVRHVLTKFIGSSFFFPTFRNIEGGFTTEKYNFKHEIFKKLLSSKNTNESESVDLITDLNLISDKLSTEEHKFVTSVSSSHINKFLISKYAEIMSLIQPYQAKRKELTDQFIKSHIFETNKDGSGLTFISKDEDLVGTLRNQIFEIENICNDIQKPLKRFHDSIRFFLKDYKFHFSKKVQFSKISQNSDEEILDIRDPDFLKSKLDYPELFDINLLSAGEKQILTLISYNSFIDNTIFFIDEPEISLHADWQRILFRILMKQNPTNQFIITTQSPFIYSKYPKNEICVDPTSDRGDSEE